MISFLRGLAERQLTREEGSSVLGTRGRPSVWAPLPVGRQEASVTAVWSLPCPRTPRTSPCDRHSQGAVQTAPRPPRASRGVQAARGLGLAGSWDVGPAPGLRAERRSQEERCRVRTWTADEGEGRARAPGLRGTRICERSPFRGPRSRRPCTRHPLGPTNSGSPRRPHPVTAAWRPPFEGRLCCHFRTVTASRTQLRPRQGQPPLWQSGLLPWRPGCGLAPGSH